MSEEQIVVYNTARFHIPEGLYSIEELEELLRMLKDIREMQSEHLKTPMQQPLKVKYCNSFLSAESMCTNAWSVWTGPRAVFISTWTLSYRCPA